jgi:phage/plasmid-like protein (TIGR03299 family)
MFNSFNNATGTATAADAISKAGLDWTVGLQPVFVQGGYDTDGNPTYHMVDGQLGVVRQDNQNVLGIVGNKYRSVQNADAFGFIDSIIGNGTAAFNSAGSFGSGRKVWLSVDMGQVEIKNPNLVGDSVKKYLILSNTHDGSGALRVFFSNVRIVCQNTLNMALKTAGKDGISIRHTESAGARMEQAKKIITLADQYQTEFVSLANSMASTPFTLDQMKKMALELLPAKQEEVPTRTENAREELISLFAAGKGNAGKTVWDAYNAATEYSDHHRGTRISQGRQEAEVRLESNWYGGGFLFKNKALDLAVAAVR